MHKLIFLEGCQGAGKTSLLRQLKNVMPYAQTLTLSGNKDRDELKSFKNHFNVLQFIKSSRGYDYIVDRSFLSELCYSKLYRDGNFCKFTPLFQEELSNLGVQYQVMFVTLLPQEETLERNLGRDKAEFSDVKFSVDNSLKQSYMYSKIQQDLIIPNVTLKLLTVRLEDSVESLVKNILSDFKE